ncbi:uncharacterized protein LOC135712034 [Ochlerotatus camptorhynchus]|uniref:uncharacterized protein LOC135712034 n=1 Tax=Ochlerotatus camptorhynchus TaxID=644619 RepID=UPI0031D083C0
MAGSSAEAAARIKRIADSRKTGAGRVTRQTKKKDQEAASNTLEQQTQDGAHNEEAQRKTVVLEMIDIGKDFPSHPTLLGKYLRDKGFHDFSEISKLGKFRFKVDTEFETQLRQLKLADANLRLYEPKSRDHTITFIRGVPTSFNEEEMLENIEAEHRATKVQRIKRRSRNGELLDTTNIKVTVEGAQVPKWVKIFGCNFRPELYIFPIRQCRNCWRFGHGAKFCTSRARCANCGGTHSTADCNMDVKCPNCKLRHGASDIECLERKRHVKIRETMRERQITFTQAETHFPKLQNRFNLLDQLGDEGNEGDFPRLGGSDQPNWPFAGPRPQRRQSSRSRDMSRERQEPTTPNEEGERGGLRKLASTCPICQENPFKATDFERFITWLRQQFFAEVRHKRWSWTGTNYSSTSDKTSNQSSRGNRSKEKPREPTQAFTVECKKLIILQHNVQSLRPVDTREELSQFLSENSVGVALLQEIWLRKEENFRLAHFRLESARRNQGYGGVGILVHETLDYETVQFEDLLPVEVVGVKITKGFFPLTLVSVYVPSGYSPLSEIRSKILELFEKLDNMDGEILIGGDFNSHHRSWDPGATNCYKGNLLNSILEPSKFILLNDGTTTCMSTVNRSSTAIDLSLATAGLATKASWEVVPQEFGSNHLSIVIEIASEIPVALGKMKRVNKDKAAELINQLKPQYIYNPDEMQTIFEDSIEQASFIIKDKKGNYLKRWWSEDINECYKTKREKLRIYNRNKSITNHLELQKARAILKRLIRKAKRAYCQELAETVDEDTPPRQLWNIIKGLDTALTQPVSRKPETTLDDAVQFLAYYYDGKLKPVGKPTSVTPSHLKGYEMALQVEEILEALKKKKSHSAPGEDGMSYGILKNLRLDMQVKVCEMLNEVFVSEVIPERWRTTQIKPIPKNKGDPLNPGSNRPIALMNINLKLINSVINSRLADIAEIENLHPPRSFGFRKHRSAQSCVNYVVNKVKDAQLAKKDTVVVFLDLSQAFDCVNLQTLLNTLKTLSIPNKIISWLHTYLSDRHLVLKTNEGDAHREVSEGLPQGCPLSPILFNLYTSGLHRIEHEGCELVQFADDFAVVATGSSPEDAATKANNYLSQLQTELTRLELKINVSKSAAVAFTRKDTSVVRIRIGRENVDLNNTHRYLGYTVDRTLTHRKHIEDIRDKAAAKVKIIKMLGKRSSSANPNTLVKIGNAIIRSRLEYGAQIYGNAAKTNLQKLQTVHNSYLRSAMRYLKTTPIHVIHAETGQTPLDIRRELLTLKELLKSTYHTNQLQPFSDRSIRNNLGNGSYWTETAVKFNYIICQMNPKDSEIAFLNRRQYSDYTLERNIKEDMFEHQNKKENYSQQFWNLKFLEIKNLYYEDFHHLYTDASKTTTGTALAVYDHTDQQVLTQKINPNYTITNAELLAIRSAIELAKEKKYHKAVIFTDSKGACQTIRNRSKQNENFLAWEIVKLLKQDRNYKIKLQWIPSHQGIPGNEKADEEAVRATQGPQTNYNSLTLPDAILLAKADIWDDWITSYRKISEEKGIWHLEIMETPGEKIWFHGLNLNTEEKTIIGRIRTGHTNTKERRYKWGWEINDSCELCDETEDLQHLLYYCPKFNIERSEHIVLEYCKPLTTILKENNETDLKEIVAFIKRTKIQT